jgi:hypothetical protein
MAAGGVFWDRFESRPLRAALFAMPLGIAVVISPIVLPILPPAQLARYSATLGVVPEIEQQGKPLALPQWFADRIGWEQYVAVIEGVYARLPEREKARSVLLARSYGAAGSVNLLGRGLPPVYALQNSYHSWGPPEPFEVAIAVQFSERELLEYFESATRVGEVHCRYCRHWRNPTPVYVVRGLKRPIPEVWGELGYLR